MSQIRFQFSQFLRFVDTNQLKYSLPLTENNVHASDQAQVKLRMLAGSALSALAHMASPIPLFTFSPVTRTYQYFNAL